jgi:hypothetical protein
MRASDFAVVSFVHDKRTSNGDAHKVARSSVYDSLGRHVWFISSYDGICNHISPSNQ